ncbi:MAG: T3SS (YopN, CesT) and YbjN peptide-binding chaperone 1, partial [Acidimicrobiales bacterium]
VLAEVLQVDEDGPVEVSHGSDREEHELRLRVEAMRSWIEPVLAAIVGAPAARDRDGDYVVDLGRSRVFVAPRARPGRPAVVRVFAITNAGLELTPELGLYLARLNFSLTFGRFSVDADHGAVWFDETLLGDHTTPDELNFTVQMVASTASAWDGRIAEIFGGRTRLQSEPPGLVAGSRKPGEGGYL